MKTYIITLVVEDSWEFSGDPTDDNLFDAFNNLLPCSCQYTDPQTAECDISIVSMNVFQHDDDEYVDWYPKIVNFDDEEGVPPRE